MTIDIRRNSLANSVHIGLNTESGRFEETAIAVGHAVGTSEDYLTRAFSLSADDKEKVAALARDMGLDSKFTISSTEQAQTALEGLQQIAKLRYEKASRSMSMLVQLLSNVHQNMMNIIQSIRTR